MDDSSRLGVEYEFGDRGLEEEGWNERSECEEEWWERKDVKR